MLEFNGDFLVRKSSHSPGQFVLSGKQGGAPRHLLLVDPKGVVSRTISLIYGYICSLRSGFSLLTIAFLRLEDSIE